MTNYQANWLYNLILKLAVAVCLGTLALSLAGGVNPLIALFRSGTAFTTFALLGWATSIVWDVPEVEADQSDDASATDKQQQPETTADPQTNEAQAAGEAEINDDDDQE